MTWLHFTDGYFPQGVYKKTIQCVYTAPPPPLHLSKHRKLMENVIGRKLKKEEHIHHINKNHDDNRIENLMIVTPEEHVEIHRKYPKVTLDLTCAYCKKEFRRETTTQKIDYIKEHNQTRFYCSSKCHIAYQVKNKRVLTEEERKHIDKGIEERLTAKEINEKHSIPIRAIYEYLRNTQSRHS